MPGCLTTAEHPSECNYDDPRRLILEAAMTTTKTDDTDRNGEQPAIPAPPIVSPEAWEAARQELLVKEKALTRARDALAAERRRMPWLAVKKKYEFDGPKGKVS